MIGAFRRDRLSNRVFHADSHGQFRGRWRVRRRAEDAIRAGTVTKVRRMVAVLALASAGPVMAAAARVRLNAIPASTNQAARHTSLNSGPGERHPRLDQELEREPKAICLDQDRRRNLGTPRLIYTSNSRRRTLVTDGAYQLVDYQVRSFALAAISESVRFSRRS